MTLDIGVLSNSLSCTYLSLPPHHELVDTYCEMSINFYFGIGLMSKPPDIGMDSCKFEVLKCMAKINAVASCRPSFLARQIIVVGG